MSTWTSSQLKYLHASVTLGFNQGKIFIIKAPPPVSLTQICVKHMGFPYRVIQEIRPWVVHHAPCSEMQILPWRSRCSAGYRQEESEVFAVSTFLHRGPVKRPKQFSLDKGPLGMGHLRAVTEELHCPHPVLVHFTLLPHQKGSNV